MNTRLVDRLQRFFVDATRFSVWIVDSTGNLVTEPLFSTPEGEQIYETSGKGLLPLKSRLLKYGAKDGPILIDCGETGWQVVITLFLNEEGSEHYLCTGPVRIEADKRMLVERTEDLRLMLASYFKHERMDESEKLRAKLLDELANRLQTNGLDENSVLDILLSSGLEVDFAGYASKGDRFQYSIQHTAGKLGGRLQGASFFAGEGYLGQVAVTGLAKWWLCTPGDPRTQFFQAFDMELALLFAYPVKKNGDPAGILYYGIVNGTAAPFSPMHIHWGSLLVAILGEALVRRQLEGDLELQLGRVKTLMEVAGLLANIGSLKRAMYVLVDMSLNLIQGTQSSICLVRIPETGNIQIVSRGLSADRADQFGKAFAAEYFPGEQEPLSMNDYEEQEMQHFACSTIVFKNDVIGVICVDCGKDGPSAEARSLLDALTAMGAFAVERSLLEGSSSHQTTGLLYEAMTQLDPAKATVIHTCRELASLFARYLNWGTIDAQRLDTAASMLGYDPSFLRHAAVGTDVMDIIEEYHLLVQTEEQGIGSDSYSPEAKILYYTMRHIISARPQSKAEKAVDEIEKQFYAFLEYRELKSRELAAAGLRSGEPLSDEELHLVDAAEFAALSPRELEVLTLITRGSSNKRIAKALYISEHTVKNHITNIFNKLGVTDRSQLIAMAYQSRSIKG